MGQIQTTISLVMIALFSFAILSFAVNYASDNSSAVSISDDPELSSLTGTSQGNLSSFSSGSEDQYKSIVETTIEPTSGSAQSVGPFAVTPTSALGATKNIVQVGYVKVFGSGTGFGVFIGALISVLVFMLGLYLYKTLRGNPD